MNEQKSAEWHRQVRHGALESFAHFRRLLKQGGELSSDDREGLIDLIDFTEDHMMSMWDIVDQDTQRELMTKRAGEGIKGA